MVIHRLGRQSMLVLGFLATAAGAAFAQQDPAPVKLLRHRAPEERPQLMLVASTHLANYGKDVVNRSVPDVLEPQRQKEIEAVADALARFRPTKIAVEVQLADQAKLDERYDSYRKGTRKLTSEELEQLGMRIAAGLGHSCIYAVDWKDVPPGPIAEYDYRSWAAKNGQQARMTAMADPRQAQEENAMMRREPVTAWYVHFNLPEQLAKSNRAYFDYAMFNDGTEYPGANWVGAWYARNLKIFANLVTLADKPEDRVLVIYGAGHVFPLRQYAEQSGAFTVVDPLPLLKAARLP